MVLNGAVLSRKLANACRKHPHGDELEFLLKDIDRNGMKVGCAGFVLNVRTGLVVYVTTEEFGYPGKTWLTYLYRYAEGPTDYKGFVNHWTSERSLDELARKVVQFTIAPEQYNADSRIRA